MPGEAPEGRLFPRFLLSLQSESSADSYKVHSRLFHMDSLRTIPPTDMRRQPR